MIEAADLGKSFVAMYHPSLLGKPEPVHPYIESGLLVYEHKTVGSIKVATDGSYTIFASADEGKYSAVIRTTINGEEYKRETPLAPGEGVKYFGFPEIVHLVEGDRKKFNHQSLVLFTAQSSPNELLP